MIKNFKKGFTLIELLVVIAIIGVLASVVLAATNTARVKGSDAAAISGIDNMRAQAAIYYDGTGAQSYGAPSAACDGSTAGSLFADPIIKAALAQVLTNAVATACKSVATAPATTASTYGMAATLKGTGFYCVDSNGTGKKSIATAFSGGLAGSGATFALDTDTGLCN